MMHRRFPALFALFFVSAVGTPALAQSTGVALTLAEAIQQALVANPDVQAAGAATREADARTAEARAGYLPRLDVVESWQRGNQPVFAFSTLLGARQFMAANFAIDALNHPSAVDAHRLAFEAQETVFDGLRTPRAIAAARLGREQADAALADARSGTMLATTDAYGKVVLAMLLHAASTSAVEAATGDLARTRERRDVGMATDADVLSLEVHLAQMREREIRMRNDQRVALADLNRLTGAPLDRAVAVQDAGPAPAMLVAAPAAAADPVVLARRPDVQRARSGESLATLSEQIARGAFLPQVALQGGYERTGLEWGTRAGSWIVGAQVRWNLFAGGADAARLRASTAAVERARAERRKAEDLAALDLLRARANAEAAVAREAVGRAAATQARESQRMLRDRYEAGLSTVTDLLRAATAVLDAEAQAAAARVDVMVSAAALQRAMGVVP